MHGILECKDDWLWGLNLFAGFVPLSQALEPYEGSLVKITIEEIQEIKHDIQKESNSEQYSI